MENALLIGLSRQMAMRQNMDIIANNLANMNTTAFKGESVLFEEYVVRTTDDMSPDRTVSFVRDVGLNRNLTTGNLTATGNVFDFAISGDGFFQVQTEDGIRYTRNGHFSTDDQGRLVTSTGDTVLSQAGGPIVLTLEDGEIAVASDGTISGDQGDIGRLGVVRFENPRLMSKTGDNLMETDQDSLPPEADTKLVQGMLEASNVQPITEMTRMIETLRAYTSANKLVETTSDLQRRAINLLGRPPT